MHARPWLISLVVIICLSFVNVGLSAPSHKPLKGSSASQREFNDRAGPPPELFQGENPDKKKYVQGEVLVKFHDAAPTDARKQEKSKDATHDEVGAEVLGDFRRTGWQRVRGKRGQSTEELIEAYTQQAEVANVEPNWIIEIDAIPDDPSFSALYGLHNIGQTGGTVDADIDAPEAWERQTGSRGIIVADIDTGVDYTHPDLAANMWVNGGEIPGNGIDDDGNGFVDDVHGYDFFSVGDSDPMDDHGHGTHTAGTIAAVGNNGIGVTGVAWNAKIMALKFLNSGGRGDTADAIEAIEYAVANGARILSNSWGGTFFSQALLDSIEAAEAVGVLFVAAAGNAATDTDSGPHYPAAYPAGNIIAVAATDHNDALASFSNYGADSVDIGAPGVRILSTVPTGRCALCAISGYLSLSGTSMATPHVAGAAAVVWSEFPELSAGDIKSLLLSAADVIPALVGKTVSGGRLNVNNAINPSFSMTLDPPTKLLFSSQSITITITIRSLNGFNGPVTLSTEIPDPATMTATFAPAIVTPSADGVATATLTIDSTIDAPTGVYSVLVQGSGEINTTYNVLTLDVRGPETLRFEPILLKDLIPGPDWGWPEQTVSFKGKLYFVATTPEYGTELMMSDGTPEGTVVVNDLEPGPRGTRPNYLTKVGDTLYFSAGVPGGGLELWKSDGTAEGTVLVADLNGIYSTQPSYLTPAGDVLYFSGMYYIGNSGSSILYRSDGTAGGTHPLAAPGDPAYQGLTNPYEMTAVDDTLFFAADSSAFGVELWKTDGTLSGTILVKDIAPGGQGSTYPSSSFPTGLTVLNDTLYFAANDGEHGLELWKSDGTEAGTVMVKDINPGDASGIHSGFRYSGAQEDNGVLYFAANDGESGYELWRSDGTAAGTFLVKDIAPGYQLDSYGNPLYPAHSFPERFTFLSGKVYFAAYDGVYGRELWSTDGTEAGTVLVKDIATGGDRYGRPYSSGPYNFTLVNNLMYFSAWDPVHSNEPRVTDGTANGTQLLKDIWLDTSGYGDYGSYFRYPVDVNGVLYFSADDYAHGQELWVYTPLNDRVSAEGDLIFMPITAFSAARYNATGLPSGLTMNPVNGLISGTIDQRAAAGSPYRVTITIGNAVFQRSKTFSWTIVPIAYAQADAGIIIMEAELNDGNIVQGEHAWTNVTAADASGGAALEATPNIGTNNNNDYMHSSPRLDFDINFTATGTYYVWLRGRADSPGDSSMHLGFDDAAIAEGVNVTLPKPLGDWKWTGHTNNGTRLVISVDSPGLHTLNVWMREDGLVLDKLMVTPQEDYTPSGAGPSVTERR